MFNKFHWHVQNKCDSKTDDKRKEESQQNLRCVDNDIQILHSEVEQHRKCNKPSDLFHIFFVQLHFFFLSI